MDRIIRRRAVVLMLLFSLMATFLGITLNNLMNSEAGRQKDNVTKFETRTRVKAVRGNILDRNGNVLVTNRASYDLMINHFVLTSSDNPNETLLKLVKLCREKGITFTENLPITKETPFEYTLSDYNTTWQNHFQSFLIYRDNLDSDITATLLMQKLRESYLIPEEWNDEDARAVLGLRYELSLRMCVTSLSNYILMTDVSSDVLAAVLELGVPGLSVETSSVRQYKTPYAAHVLGYVGAMSPAQWETYKELGYSLDALVGQDGFEEAFEPYLHGVDGTRVDVVTKDGTLVESYYEVAPQAGQNVQVSLDLHLQTAAEDALAITIENLRNPEVNKEGDGLDAAGAAVVAMDIKSGQVLVCGSYPTYDLSHLFDNYADLMDAELQPLFNRALQAEYPPGSTYKMSMVVAGIDGKKISITTDITDKGKFTKYEGFDASCLTYTKYGTTHGAINAMEALKVSCNYFFYDLGDRLSIEQIDSVAKGLGLGEHTGIELYERIGHRANPETKAKLYTGDNARWYMGDQILASIGQSDNRFTPMQLCSYVTTLVNQGTRYKATFLNRVVSSDYSEIVMENGTEILSKFQISDQAYNAYTTGMKMAASESGGTAYSTFRGYPVKVAAKTGTAQTGVNNHSDNGAFVCYAPADDPQIAVVVYGERAGHGRSLGDVAKQVLDAYFGFGQYGDIVTPENGVS